MTTRRGNRRALQDVLRLRSKLEEVVLREEVREELDVLDKQGVPLRKQPARATPAVIDARTTEQIKSLVLTELLEVLVDDEPPAYEPEFLRWYLGLTGRSKPRASRIMRRAG